ncbi:YidB family protein [Methylobacterium sp. E-041]|nr:YidB family protein [Methylobacterium sp. E-041]
MDKLDTHSRQAGLSRNELLSWLSSELPSVDRYTPDGRLPAH